MAIYLLGGLAVAGAVAALAEVEVDSANKFFFTELAFGKEREDTTALVCAESAEANGATHANMAPVAIIATDVEIIVLTLIINAIH